MIQNENQLTSLPFYTAERHQDRFKWWVQSLYRLFSPNDRFLPFQICKEETSGGAGATGCTPPTSIDYDSDFSTDIDGWRTTDVTNMDEPVLSVDSGRLRIDIPANNSNGFFALRKLVSQTAFDYNASTIDAVLSADNSVSLTGYSYVLTFESSLGDISPGPVVLSDSQTGDTYDPAGEVSFGLRISTASATTIFLDSCNTTAVPYKVYDNEEVYASDWSVNVDGWAVDPLSTPATITASAGDLVRDDNGVASVTIYRSLSYSRAEIQDIYLDIAADIGDLTSVRLVGINSGGSEISRELLIGGSWDFATQGSYNYSTANFDGFTSFSEIRVSTEYSGNISFSQIDVNTIAACIPTPVGFWAAADIVDAKTGAETDVLTYMNENTEIETFADYQVAIYKGGVALAAVMVPGYYYLKLNDGTNEFFSEVFNPCSSLDGLIKIEWWRDIDLNYKEGSIVYSTGYINTMYLDGDIGKPKHDYDIEQTVRNGYKFKQKIVSVKQFGIKNLVLSEPIIDVLSRIPHHEYVQIVDENITYKVIDITIPEPDWEEEGDVAKLGIEFETDNIITSGTSVAQAYNQLLGDPTDAINIRGNNKRIYQLSDLLSTSGLYLPGDKDGLSEAVRIPIQTLLEGDLSNVESITFDNDPPVITSPNTLQWNNKEYTINVITGLGATIQVGLETLILYYNNTGVTIDNFSVMHLAGAELVSGVLVKTFELADASIWEKCQGTLAVATHSCAPGNLGFLTIFGDASDGDTSHVAAGTQLWVSDTTPGMFTDVQPQFPNFAISIGGSFNSSATEGKIFINITGSVDDIYHSAWDGSIIETFDFLVDSDGTTILGTLSNSDVLRNLVIRFSTGFYTLDTTTAPLTIALIPGTDELTATNYVYIPESTKTLTISTSGWPSVEHAKVALLEVQSAVTVQSDGGARRNQNVNDHLKSTGDNGHILHMAERIRRLNADHANGTEGSLDNTGGNGYIVITSGEVWQMHKQTFPAFSMIAGDTILAVNDFTTAHKPLSNLAAITAYSTGSTWNNEWGKIVVWGIANKTSEPSFGCFNLPSDGYNSEAAAIADASNYADYTIPDKYKGVGFLIGAFTFRISSGTITYNGGSAYQDLRGFVPNNIAGGGGGGGIDDKVGITSADTTPSYLDDKVVVTANLLKTIVNSGVNEQLLYDIAATINKSVAFELGVKIDPNQTFLQANGLTFGDGVSGIYESSANVLNFVINSNSIFATTNGGINFLASRSPSLRNINGNTTLPAYTFTADPNTGIGQATADQFSLIAGGVEAARMEVGVQKFYGQAIGGDEIKTFASTPEFDFNDGNTQEITLTGNIISWTIANDLPAGQYTIYFIQDGTGGWAIPDPTGIDRGVNESLAAFDLTAGIINIVNIFITPGAISGWSLVGTM